MKTTKTSKVHRRDFLLTNVAASVVAGIACGQAASSFGSEASDASVVQGFPFYRAQGSHRELGRQHGQQAMEHIKAHLEYMGESMKLSIQDLRDRAMRFEPLLRQHCPHLMDEIEGLAEGASIAYADALAVNIRGALVKANDEGCTAFVVSRRGTAAKEILIGQNSDLPPIGMQLAYVLYLKPIDKPEILMWTFGGMIGYHGINSVGIGHFANDLGGGPTPRFGMPHYPPKRLMHECHSMAEVKELMGRIPWWTNGNYVLCDGQGDILDIEATPEGPQVIHDNGAGFIAHTNHFLCAKYATKENHDVSAKDSFTRLSRMDELIRARFGQLTVADFRSILRDRQNDPNGICRIAQTDRPDADWQTASMTVASIIAEPARRCMHIAAGNRADAPLVTYSMDS